MLSEAWLQGLLKNALAFSFPGNITGEGTEFGLIFVRKDRRKL